MQPARLTGVTVSVIASASIELSSLLVRVPYMIKDCEILQKVGVIYANLLGEDQSNISETLATNKMCFDGKGLMAGPIGDKITPGHVILR